jgi:hypothetical protein
MNGGLDAASRRYSTLQNESQRRGYILENNLAATGILIQRNRPTL